MVVDASYITAISGGDYTVGTTGTITQTTFDLFKAQAIKQAIADAPKAVKDETTFDELVGLLICYRISRMDRKLDISSEKLGADVSYSKTMPNGTTSIGNDSWLVAYQNLITSAAKTAKRSIGVLVEHTDVAGTIKLDDSTIGV